MIIDGKKIKGRIVKELSTHRSQKLHAGDKVAYVQPLRFEQYQVEGGLRIPFTGGTLHVSVIAFIEEGYPAFAESDGEYLLHLINGDTVECSNAVKIDGECICST